MKKVLAVLGALVVCLPLLGLLAVFASVLPFWSVVGSVGLCASVLVWWFMRSRRSGGGSELSFLGANRPAKEGLL
jgi:hypothetical protein